jgi:hypothetical protein
MWGLATTLHHYMLWFQHEVRTGPEASPEGVWNASGRPVGNGSLATLLARRQVFGLRCRRLAGARLSRVPSSRSKSVISWKSL